MVEREFYLVKQSKAKKNEEVEEHDKATKESINLSRINKIST